MRVEGGRQFFVGFKNLIFNFDFILDSRYYFLNVFKEKYLVYMRNITKQTTDKLEELALYILTLTLDIGILLMILLIWIFTATVMGTSSLPQIGLFLIEI